MDDLAGRRIFVAGGTGDVGEGIVVALLGRGAEVVVPVRSREKGERLRAAIGANARLTLISGEVGQFEGAETLAAKVAGLGSLHGVIASLGGWWQGSTLVDVAATEWHRVIADNLTSHQAVARAFVPRLSNRGAYVQILGAAAESPVARSSLVSITAAAVSMLGRALYLEAPGGGVRIRQIMIDALVATRSRASAAATGTSAEEVGSLAADLIADVDGESRLVWRIPGLSTAQQ